MGHDMLHRVLRLLTKPLRLARGVANAALRLTGSQPQEPSTPTKRPAAPTRGRAGKYDQSLTQLVARRPGVTVAQAAQELDVDATALYPVIRRLEARGALVKLGRELHPGR